MYICVNNYDAYVYFVDWPVFVLLSPPFETVTPEDFDRQFSANASGLFFTVQKDD